MVALVGGFMLGYRVGYVRASKPAVIFARDAADSRPSGTANEGYEPYFTRGNPISRDHR